MSAFIEIITRNVLREEVKVFTGFSWRSRYDWGIKDITKDCKNCLHCIGKEEAIVIIEIVNLNKGRCNWQPPLAEEILGICLWGVSPKILCSREKPRKCQYFKNCICAKYCDCENPPPDDWDGKEGIYLLSEECPIHNLFPRHHPNCSFHR